MALDLRFDPFCTPIESPRIGFGKGSYVVWKLERDIWYKRLTSIEIVGYVIADHRDAESMERRKMRLNHFVAPERKITAVLDNGKCIDFIMTESVRYGATHTENNEAFCKFMITGLYRQSDIPIVPPVIPPVEPTQLPAPMGVAAIRKNISTITVNWNTVSNASGYRIEYIAAGGIQQYIENIPSGITSYDISGLTNDTTYSVRVMTLGTGNFLDSPWSNTVSVPPIDIGVVPPATPENFRSAGRTANTVSLAWDAVSDATSYGIQYRTGSGSWLMENVAITGTTAVVSGLTANTTYEFQVRATNSGGSSAWSASVSETTDIYIPPVEPPTTPTNFRSTAQTETSVTLAWDSQSNLTGYTLQYRASGTTTWTTWTPAPGASATSATITGLAAGTTYEFQLTATNTGGSASSTTNATTSTIVVLPVDPFTDIQNTAAKNSGVSYRTVSTFGESTSCYGGVLAPNGKIYGIPGNSVLEIDPIARTTNTFGTVSGGWRGSVLAPNGKIYGIPAGYNQILEIDPMARTATTFGSLSKTYLQWFGGVLAPNGKIYGIPYQSTAVLEIDPIARIATIFGNLSEGYNDGDEWKEYYKWSGGVLAPNGKIYGIPATSRYILEIDPFARTATTFGNVGDGDRKWSGGVLAPNGKIYGIPNDYSNHSVLEIDPFARTATTFGNVGLAGQRSKWSGGVLAPNGMIYGMPDGSEDVIEIDPVNRIVSTFYTGQNGTRGGILAPNGKIYGICPFQEFFEIGLYKESPFSV